MTSMTLHEVAAELGVHYMTVYRYVRLGYLDAHKEGGTWRVDRSALDDFKKPAAAPAHSAGSAAWDRRLMQRLLAADQAGAWKVVEAAQASGKQLREIYVEMVIPAMRAVGDRWAQGTVTVAEEHAASQVMVRIVSRLSAQIARRGLSKGTVVMGTPMSELHVLPLMVAADLIRLEGFEVLDLGCKLPGDSFAATAAKQQRLVAVCVSATSPDQVGEIQATVEELRRLVDAPIFLGGAAIDGAEHAKLLGADSGAPRVEDIIPRLLDLAG
jgi:MerR family transcriptional regulator, light-induced transcriptional regulator